MTAFPVLRRFAACLAALLLLAARPMAAAEPNRLAPEQIADGWISLFDGETLFGWTPTSNANWRVEDGAITVSDGAPGFLATNAEFADYELDVEFKAPPTTNSGIFLHASEKSKNPAADCYELNIAPHDNPFPTSSLVARRKFPNELEEYFIDVQTSSKENQADSEESLLRLWDGDWHSFNVRLKGKKVRIEVDGFLRYKYINDAELHRGRIALQFREGPVAFRNIRLKPLGLKPMLNGRDLAGWNTANVENSKFEVVADEDRGRESFATSDSPDIATPPVAKDSRPLPRRHELHVTNGRGILETEASYGDFIMQLDAFVDGDGLNSGVFFRSIPREYANGYESQIHNAYKNNDPTQPADFGTGGIYRRVPARRVVSRDREWFTKTIVATGPRIAVWVNGYQVTDWTDTRPEHDNPRNGLRVKPGTISLQGHDPTTNLRFRNLRISELPEATHTEN